ncbi:MAG: BrnT family toxin [Bauldia sp.]|nr:BrnT family toxin [Bauldia sp.]
MEEGGWRPIETIELAAFEWDERKREANLSKHGIDFADAALALSQPYLAIRSDRSGEARWLALAAVNGRVIAVVYVLRAETCRIISARAARSNEREAYKEQFGEGDAGVG